MCMGGKNAAPIQQPQLPEAPVTPDVNTSRSTNSSKKRIQAASTILTSGQGVTDQGVTQTKTLLGG